MPAQNLPRLVDSITELDTTASGRDVGCIAISGSHGGTRSARYAIAARPLLTVFNDAGVGLNGAGIAALALMQQAGLAACTVAHTSARIGKASSTWQTGTINHANALAQAMGVQPEQNCQKSLAVRV